ncbi:MAG: entry exclusion lipoprotein TrbK [Pseudomonadota bacterium]
MEAQSEKDGILKSKTNALITLAASALLGIFGYRSLTRQVQPIQATAANCKTEYIRSVNDSMERAILSGQCAKAAKP